MKKANHGDPTGFLKGNSRDGNGRGPRGAGVSEAAGAEERARVVLIRHPKVLG